jgi:ribosomal protein L7/L12/methionine-rich copper-binding protein CopC
MKFWRCFMKKLVSMICIAVMITLTATPVTAAAKDTKAPVITKSDPADCATDVMVDDTIVIRFSEAIKKGKSIAKINLKESDLISVAFTYEITGNLLKIMPKEKLKYDMIYTVSIPASAVKDAAGNNFARQYILTLITEADPNKAADTAGNSDGLKYILEIEAAFDSELTKDKIAYFTELLSMFGIDAKFLSVTKADDAAGNSSGEGNSGTGNPGGISADAKYSNYVLLLKDPGPEKAKVIKYISKLTGVSLSESKKMADGAPILLLKSVTLDQADTAKQKLEALEASVSVIGIE